MIRFFFFLKIVSFSQIIPYWESKFEEAGRTAICGKNHPKIFRRFLNIVPKSLSGGGFEWLWGGLGQLLSGSWVTSGAVFGGLGELLGVMLGPKIPAKSGKYKKKCRSETQAIPQRFFGWIFCRR